MPNLGSELTVALSKFPPENLKGGEIGGHSAVQSFLCRIEGVLKSINVVVDRDSIRIRAYANKMDGLRGADDTDLSSFFDGFNKSHALAELVDVEVSIIDEKICGMSSA